MARGRFSVVCAVVIMAFTAAPSGCGRGGNVVEARPMAAPLDNYKTSAIEVDPKAIENPEKEGPSFIAYLETKLETLGVLRASTVEQGAELLLRVRPGPGAGTDDDLHLTVDLLDTKTRATIGQIEVTTSPVEGKTAATLRKSADDIATYLKNARKRPLPPAKKSDFTPPPPVTADAGPAAPVPGVVKTGECTTTCRSDSTSAVLPDDLQRVAERIHPTLQKVRGCLDRVSAQSIQPSIILRFESAGQLTSLRIDAGGYDELACILEARQKIPYLATTRVASMRCDHQCR